jgi:putative flippase GtrA
MIKKIDWKIFRWFIVGCITFLIDYITFLSFYALISSIAIANLISSTISCAFNYLCHYRWTFKSDTGYFFSYTRYIATVIFIYFLNTMLIKIFITFTVSPALSKIFAAAFQAPISYFILNFIVFRKNFKNNTKFN